MSRPRGAPAACPTKRRSGAGVDFTRAKPGLTGRDGGPARVGERRLPDGPKLRRGQARAHHSSVLPSMSRTNSGKLLLR